MKKGASNTLFNRSSEKKMGEAPSSDGSKSASSGKVVIEQSVHELEEVFKKFDANGDGKISGSDLADILRSLGSEVGEAEVKAMMEEADADGDGYVSLQEFVDLNKNGASVKDLKNAFKVFDQDCNGSISAAELCHTLKSVGEPCTIEESKNIIHNVDKNGDGLISVEEFQTMMTSEMNDKSK